MKRWNFLQDSSKNFLLKWLKKKIKYRSINFHDCVEQVLLEYCRNDRDLWTSGSGFWTDDAKPSPQRWASSTTSHGAR